MSGEGEKKFGDDQIIAKDTPTPKLKVLVGVKGGQKQERANPGMEGKPRNKQCRTTS